jgi:hypothetical protein
MEPEIVVPDEIWYKEDLRGPQENRGPSETPLQPIHLQDAIKWGLSCGAARWFKSG